MAEFTLKLKIQDNMKAAMRAKATLRLDTIRMLLAAIKQKEIDDRVTVGDQPLNDGQIIAIIDKMIKQRQESIIQYQKGNRADLVAREQTEIEILKEYLPQPLNEAEITALIKQAIAETGATSIKDMAKVMNFIKDKAQGRADVGKISGTVKSLLGT